jgi:hypothetical protein
MALGWLALLKTVPWTDVISAAPQVTAGAKKLWDSGADRSISVAPASETQ